MIVPGFYSVFRFCTAQTDPLAGKVYLTDPAPFEYEELDDTIEHIVEGGDTWWTIAARYYTSIPDGARRWRVIAEFQPIPPIDTSIPIPLGITVYVPSERVVTERIFSESRRPDYEA